ncbi:MAG: TRAP transporter fused permease subunit [Alphaproteobacteria bacterium]|nr:TRAP transporter fused permease subunit [Alphaproteobacteria bacterium]
MTLAADRRELRPLLVAAAAVTVGIHAWLIFGGLVPNLIARPLHLAASLPWVFVFARAGSAAARWTGYAACAIGTAATAALIADRGALVEQYGALKPSAWQYAMAIALIAVVLEMARRAVQPVLPAVALSCIAYALWGEHLPGQLGHAGLPLDYFLGNMTIAEAGLWGSLTGISIELIVPFMILGACVSAGEAGTGFMALATQLAGRFQAGAAKVAVLASALYGTISGSASANVASVGSITIPAMKRMGYPATLAAATEAVASSGGQIMPPVMGSGAFIMAELIRRPYGEIAVASVLPAILFFAASWVGVHFFAQRYALAPLPRDQLPGWRQVRATAPFFGAPLAILVVLLMVEDYAAAYSALWATVATIAMLPWSGSARPSLRLFGRRLAAALVDAARQIGMIAAIIICAGIIIGVFNMTGLGVKLTSLILGISQGELWVALVLTAVACLVLGMELPTTAAYLICIAVAGPALVKLGLPELHAHMFVFWYALLCTITPPVCGTVFVAAGIAGAPWLQVALHAMRIGIGLYVVPLGFVANPALLAIDAAPALALLAAAKIGVGLWLVSYATIGSTSGLLRGTLAGAAGMAAIFAFGIRA